MDKIASKHFTILDKEGVNTVIYQVHKTKKEYAKDYPKYTLERLDYIEEINNNGTQKTFFVDNPKKSGNPLIFLSFKKDQILVNSGKLINDQVKITKKPKSYTYTTIQTSEVDFEKEIQYTPNLKRPITIIDPQTGLEVSPVLYFDEKTNQVKGKCKLKPNKAYFAFEIKN